jgi:Tol biopolymer transport system component
MAADGYPLPAQKPDGTPDGNCQVLCLIDVESGKVTEIGRFRHNQPAGTVADVRCDIHPRWSHDGKTITVDSIHSGKRAVYMLDVTELVK